MPATRTARPERSTMVSTAIPPVPLTIEGYSVLHQMMRFRWSAWKTATPCAEGQDRPRGQRPAVEDGTESVGAVWTLFSDRT